MKEYLSDFLNRYDYPDAARDVFIGAYAAICGNDEVLSSWNRMLAEYEADAKCDFGAQMKECRRLSDVLMLPDFTLKLLLFICHARHLEQLYAENGINAQIAHDSLMDLKYKMLECYEIYGVWGTFVPDWFGVLFRMKILTMGRLQFEPIRFEHTYEKNGVKLTEDSTVINVHIPRTMTPLDPIECDKAYRMAADFFAPMLGDEPCVFVCHSWLLFPENETILPPHSNLRSFMANYDILFWRYYNSENSELWRLFDTLERRPDRLPTNTSLRRAYVNHLLRGGKTGHAYGIYVPDFSKD